MKFIGNRHNSTSVQRKRDSNFESQTSSIIGNRTDPLIARIFKEPNSTVYRGFFG
jgi:hypothetical protein